MLKWTIRVILVMWSAMIVSIMALQGLGGLLNGGVLVYQAQVEESIRDTDVRLYDMHSGNSIALFRRTDLMGMDVSADGRFLALEQRLQRGRELQILHLATGEIIPIYEDDFHTARWSPDGQWVAFIVKGFFDGGIYRQQTTGNREPEIIGETNVVFALSADSESLYFSGWGTNKTPGIISKNINTGETETLLAQANLYISDMSVYDMQIAFMGNHIPMLLDVDSGDVTSLYEQVNVGASVAWSIDGERIAIVIAQPDSPLVIVDINGELLTEMNLPHMYPTSRVGWVQMR